MTNYYRTIARKAICDELDLEESELTDDSILEDLGADSVDGPCLLAALQECVVNDHEFERIVTGQSLFTLTIGQILDAVDSASTVGI